MTTRRPPLPSLPCPRCGDPMRERAGRAVRANRWTDCLRRCERCRVGISNAARNATTLHGDPALNVPGPLREGVEETLAGALNLRNRAGKRAKFGFSTSEDALTWTVFGYLHGSGRLPGVLRRAGLPIPDAAEDAGTLLLWGVPVPFDRAGDPRGWRLRVLLEAISDRLGECPGSRTEPDVVVDLGRDGIIIIEVKHRGRTDVKSEDHAGWDRYYPADRPLPYARAMRASRCYELARNWRFGLELAALPPRPLTLACLGPDDLVRGEGAGILGPFEACLPAEGEARFRKLTWAALLGAIERPPGWLVRYVEIRGYEIRKGGR